MGTNLASCPNLPDHFRVPLPLAAQTGTCPAQSSRTTVGTMAGAGDVGRNRADVSAGRSPRTSGRLSDLSNQTWREMDALVRPATATGCPGRVRRGGNVNPMLGRWRDHCWMPSGEATGERTARPRSPRARQRSGFVWRSSATRRSRKHSVLHRQAFATTLANFLAKLTARGRMDAVQRAWRLGLLP